MKMDLNDSTRFKVRTSKFRWLMKAQSTETSADLHSSAPFGALAPGILLKIFFSISTRSSIARGWFRSIFRTLFENKLDPKAIDVRRFDSNLRLYFDNISERKALITPSAFDETERAFLADHLSAPGSVFVDIGANAGLYSVSMLSKQPSIEVVCIEPNPEMLDRLRENLQTNNNFKGLGATIHIVNCAAGESESIAKLAISDENLGESTMVDERRAMIPTTKTIDVQVRRLQSVLESLEIKKVDALKIDVEGFEASVLIPFFRDGDPALFPRSLVIETIHDTEETAELSDVLKSKGYKEAGRTKLNAMMVNY